MGKTKGFLYAIQHREILMTDLGLWCYRPEKPIESYKVIILQPALLIFVILVVFLYRHIIYL